MSQPGRNAVPFPKTRWTIILEAQRAEDACPALNELCDLYWPPLYSYLRKMGHSPEDAEDLTQEFLVRYLKSEHWAEAAPERGKLRSYLLTDLKFFLSDKRKRASAQKRGGQAEIVSFERATAEACHASALTDPASTPEQVFDRAWAITLIDNATRFLDESMIGSGRRALFDVLKATLWGDQDRAYADIGKEFGLKESAVKAAAYRLRRKYHDALKAEVHQTLAEGEDVQLELRYLLSVL